MGWKPIATNVDLVFGSAWHLAMEHLLIEGYVGKSEEEQNRVVTEAFRKFEACYRDSFDPLSDEDRRPKTPANAFFALSHYPDAFSADRFNVLHTEIAGSVMLESDTLIYFKMDSIIQDELGEYASLEHKTTGAYFSNNWPARWMQKVQVGVYNHVLFCLYPEDEVKGVYINGYCPRSSDPDKLFNRCLIGKTRRQMEDWAVNLSYWIGQIQQEFEELLRQDLEAPVLSCFPKNTESCTDYGQCRFLPWCYARPNPLIGAMPQEFQHELWDPTVNLGTAKKVVEL
jgi:hypothetical protein